MSSEKELKLAAEAVKMKKEKDRLQAELGLRAERQHRAWNGQWAWLVDRAACCVFFRFVLRNVASVRINSRCQGSGTRRTSSNNMYLGSSSSPAR